MYIFFFAKSQRIRSRVRTQHEVYKVFEVLCQDACKGYRKHAAAINTRSSFPVFSQHRTHSRYYGGTIEINKKKEREKELLTSQSSFPHSFQFFCFRCRLETQPPLPPLSTSYHEYASMSECNHDDFSAQNKNIPCWGTNKQTNKQKNARTHTNTSLANRSKYQYWLVYSMSILLFIEPK